MTRSRTRLAAAFVTICLSGVSARQTPPPATPRAVLASLMKADNANDLDGVMAVYAADAALLPPNDFIVQGSEAIRQRYQYIFSSTRTAVTFVVDEEQVTGDLAYIRGRSLGSRKSSDGQSTEVLTHKFVMVLRQERSAWRITSLIWNATPSETDFERPFVEDVRVVREWRGEAAYDQFGWIARKLGDVDNDGVADIVTSAPTKAIGGVNAGRIYVYSTRTGALIWSADGQPGDRLGIGVEAAGDTNGDGIPDVIASAPGGTYASLFSGRDGRVLLTLRGEDAGDMFGRHVSGVGDVDGDGAADLIVGAPGNDAGGPDAGRAYVYSGTTGRVLLTLTGARAGDAFGSAVSGDTHNGKSLLIVGAPKAGPTNHGRVYVYDGLSSTPTFTFDADDTGAALGAMFVSVPGDVDGDGMFDIFATDFTNAARGPSTGRSYLHSGGNGRRVLTLTGETAGEGFGTSTSIAGDVNRDGHADLIIGAWQYSGAAAGGGRAYLYSGKDGALLKTYTCRIAGDAFGFDANDIGDVDGDGMTDFVITSAWSGVHGFHSGRMFVISSGVLANTIIRDGGR
jgi:ketosteroid isomerase-like protein